MKNRATISSMYPCKLSIVQFDTITITVIYDVQKSIESPSKVHGKFAKQQRPPSRPMATYHPANPPTIRQRPSPSSSLLLMSFANQYQLLHPSASVPLLCLLYSKPPPRQEPSRLPRTIAETIPHRHLHDPKRGEGHVLR